LRYFIRNVLVVQIHWWLRWLISVGLYYSGLFWLLSRLCRSLSFRNRALILRYHRVLQNGETPFYNLGIPVHVFERQVAFFARRWRPIPLRSLVKRLKGRQPIPPRTLVITFDDGYRDNFELAASVLQRHGVPATFFVTTNFIDRPHEKPWWDELAEGIAGLTGESLALRMNGTVHFFRARRTWERMKILDTVLESMKALGNGEFHRRLELLRSQLGRAGATGGVSSRPMMTWEETRQLAEWGFEVECHTRSHPILARLPRRQWSRELFWPKLHIERKLQRPVRFLAMPNGRPEDVPEELPARLRRYGYEAAVTSVAGAVRPGDDLYLLKRRGVYSGNSMTPWGRFSPALFTLEMSGFFDRLLFRKGGPHG